MADILDPGGVVNTLLGAALAYIGYRGSQVEKRIEIMETKNAEQDSRVTRNEAKIEAAEKQAAAADARTEKALETMQFDIKEILRELRGRA